MNENKQLVDFRQRQYAQPQSAQTKNVPSFASGDVESEISPDCERAIIHFDVDCFYAQVEEVRNPALRGKPLGVTQKYLIVTSNYEARKLGVTKLMGIQDAKEKVPTLTLVSGEDLTPYRQASKRIWTLLQRFGPVQRAGMDEAFLDATAEVLKRIKAKQYSTEWEGHVWQGNESVVQDSHYRPQDLRVVPASLPKSSVSANAFAVGSDDEACLYDDLEDTRPGSPPWETLLRVASQVAAEARQLISDEAGFRSSAGIACNKILAKLASGLHKPNDQTVLPPPVAASFVAPLPVRALSGVGYKTESRLAAMGITSVAELKGRNVRELTVCVGASSAEALLLLARGKDGSPVVQSGPPKSITCEDSFKTCSTFKGVESVLRVIVPDLVARLFEELEESNRWPRSMTVKWRLRVEAFHKQALELLRKHLVPPFNLTLLNVGVVNFHPHTSPSAASSLSKMFSWLAEPAKADQPPNNSIASVDGSEDDQLGGLKRDRETLDKEAGSVTGKQLCAARRDYSHMHYPPVSKRAERALVDAGAGISASAVPSEQRDSKYSEMTSAAPPTSTSQTPANPSLSRASRVHNPNNKSVPVCSLPASASLHAPFNTSSVSTSAAASLLLVPSNHSGESAPVCSLPASAFLRLPSNPSSVSPPTFPRPAAALLRVPPSSSGAGTSASATFCAPSNPSGGSKHACRRPATASQCLPSVPAAATTSPWECSLNAKDPAVCAPSKEASLRLPAPPVATAAAQKVQSARLDGSSVRPASLRHSAPPVAAAGPQGADPPRMKPSAAGSTVSRAVLKLPALPAGHTSSGVEAPAMAALPEPMASLPTCSPPASPTAQPAKSSVQDPADMTTAPASAEGIFLSVDCVMGSAACDDVQLPLQALGASVSSQSSPLEAELSAPHISRAFGDREDCGHRHTPHKGLPCNEEQKEGQTAEEGEGVRLKAERGTEHVLTDAILQVGIGADALEEGLERAEATTPSAATEARVARGSLDCDRRIALALQRQEIRRSAAGATNVRKGRPTLGKALGHARHQRLGSGPLDSFVVRQGKK